MNISTNPWVFSTGDVIAPSVPVAATGLQQVDPSRPAAVNLTTVAAHGLAANQFISIIGTTGARFLGWYKVLAVPTTTTALLANLSSPTSGMPFNTTLAADGGGSVLVNQVQQNVKVEDIVWQNYGAAASLSLLDRNGSIVWSATSSAAETGAENRGKIKWIDGLTLQTLSSGVIFLTI